LRIELEAKSDAASGAIVVYADAVMVEKATNVENYFDGFVEKGHWQGAEHNSISIADIYQDAIISGYFTASS
jgi:hypothetical protein